MSYNGSRRDRQVLSNVYTERQVESVLNELEIDVAGDTFNDFTCMCPFHGNRHTPSMSVSKTNGKFICFNASCGATGSLTDLVKAIKKTNEFQTARLIAKAKVEHAESFVDRLKKALEPVEFTPFDAGVLSRMEQEFWNSPVAQEYMMKHRGFDESTLREYHVGYSAKKDMIAVPMYNVKGVPVGVIGRSADPENKAFKNSKGLPTSKTLWNIQKAKRTGDTVIVCEASFDAMRIAQAGYPNVVACLGGNFSDHHEQQLQMYFSNIIIFTDFDDSQKHRYVNCRKCMVKNLPNCVGHNPGRALGRKIADKMKGRKVLWASMGPGLVYPEGCKDAGDMTIDQIRQCIQNAATNREYSSWGIEE